MDPAAKEVETDKSKFGSDPTYEDKPYSAEEQIKIYARAVEVVRPLIELFGPSIPRGLSTGRKSFGSKIRHLFNSWLWRLAHRGLQRQWCCRGGQLHEVKPRPRPEVDWY